MDFWTCYLGHVDRVIEIEGVVFAEGKEPLTPFVIIFQIVPLCDGAYKAIDSQAAW